MRKKEETQLHFVGIGGIGMSGIAEVFLNQGYLRDGFGPFRVGHDSAAWPSWAPRSGTDIRPKT